MEEGSLLYFWVSLLLVAGSFFCVSAEYGLIGVRKNRIEALARKKNKSAILLNRALDDLGTYIAGIQIAITMIGIAIGAITEPYVTSLIKKILPDEFSLTVGTFISVLLVTYILVIFGELVPKYITLKHAETVALILIRPLHAIIVFLKPLIWLVRHSGGLILKPFKVDISKFERETLSKEEIAMLIKSGSNEGLFDEEHAQMVARALRLDRLDAADLMIHRLDIKWIDINTPKEKLFEKLAEIPHSRIPICDGDVDRTIGILYLPDIAKYFNKKDFQLKNILHPVVIIPENLSFSKLLTRMREMKSQILVVVDEYGGTSGMITLEDVIEEVFGEFQDALESERPTLEQVSENRISARAEVRYDELLDFIGIEDEYASTDTLATIIMEQLRHIPIAGDSVRTSIGVLCVENMARTRITRVSIMLNKDIVTQSNHNKSKKKKKS